VSKTRLQIKKEGAFAALAGACVIAISVIITCRQITKRKKQDPEMKSLHRQMMASRDINEIYGLFGALVKRRYNLSIKASSQSAVRSSTPDAELGARLADIMDFMESGRAYAADGNAALKEKIKAVPL
jgi:hypothetical protein